jgi:hypothetical protein
VNTYLAVFHAQYPVSLFHGLLRSEVNIE